ncbi:T9SS C-terminal target domain-containing protein [Paraflavitalea soli]|uniref:T9SS C-terminal target domain-containing protein n=1 Tax=Paraflavitalea soli TaxID=2315862 RepID=A0A3B7MHQ4_9BACT|nr:FG-GAP-like repeat-containing protein [Paraflavitalea soli]AXY73117.1 T9SS C-terminal target domain-containing protein [Paraflavitalea soli]
MRTLLLVLALALKAQLVFCQIPVINSFAPATGPVGTQVIITGNNFSTVSTDNKVYFGTLKATVIAASATSLTVAVPLGASFQPIAVAVNGLTGYSATPFIVTYPGGGMNFTSTSFNAPTALSGGGFVSSGDMDGDGRTDLIYTLFSFDEVHILRNTSQGNGFSYTNEVFGGTINPISAAAADLNGDGLPELIVASLTFNCIKVLKNLSTPGNILFDWPLTLGTGNEPRKLAIADLDNDGKADIVVTNQSSNTISVLRNTSTSSNISFSTRIDLATAASPEGVCIGDLDGDGNRDIAVACYSNASVIHVFKNNAVPGNMAFQPRMDLSTGPFPWDVNIGDLDGDGKPELLASGSNSVAVFKNTSAGSLSFAARIDLPTGSSPRGMALSDLDADGKPEIITANWVVESTVAVLKNNSTTGTIAFTPFITYNTQTGPGSLALADLNGDGLTDITSGNSQSFSLSYLQNNLGILTGIPQCPALVQPANNTTNLPYNVPQVFRWRKEPNATSYQLRIIQQSGAYTEVTTTDTFYTFTPAAGINYTWKVKPVNMLDAAATCPGFTFSTCAPVANAITITAEGNADKCATDSVKLKASLTGNIQWFLDQQPIAGATADTLWARAPGQYTLRVSNGGCYSDPSNTITINNLPTPVKPSLTVQGALEFCEGGSATLTSSLNINNQWFKNNTAIGTANGLTYNAITTGTYFVRVANSSSGCYNYSDTVSVTVLPVPATPTITVTGNTTFCNGGSVTLQSSAASGYQWIKSGFPIIGAGNQQYIANESGTYTVQVSANGCTSAASAGVVITVNAIPATPTITPAGNLSFCTGDSVKLQSSIASGNQWFKNGTAITGATNQDYYAKEAASYTVQATQNGCTGALSTPSVTTLLPLPAKPTISSNGIAMNATAGYTSYQWYFNNNLITGATASTYPTTQAGMYKVTVKDNKGCGITSDDFNFVYTAVNDVEWQGYTISWFPNPTHDNLLIKVTAQTSLRGLVTVRVVDMTGKLVQQEKVLKPGLNKVTLEKLPAGIYWALLKSGQSEKAVKILKVN